MSSGIPISEMQRIAVRLSNGGWVRWWAMWNYPALPAKMAIQVLDTDRTGKFVPVKIRDAVDHGLSLASGFNVFIYEVERINEDGTPYVWKL